MTDDVCRPVAACRGCGATALEPVLSLGTTPLANALTDDGAAQPRFPLDLVRCPACTLVQIGQVVSPRVLFSDYVYFSSFSDTMLRHAEALAETLVERERLGADALVVEVASNDGYLLQFFQRRGVPVLGIEPARNIARVAREKGIPTLAEFFGADLADRLVDGGQAADVVVGNNVLAHVPDLNGFVRGVARLLKPTGLAVFEAPYLKSMLDGVEFDTIYHEHQCYFSLHALRELFGRHGLAVVDVTRLPIHGGSLRVWLAPAGARAPAPAVADLLAEEAAWGVGSPAPYARFAGAVERLRAELRAVLDDLRSGGSRLAAYGAAAKGVTLLSYCGVGADYLDFVVDRSTYKQGKRYPVDALPILPPEALLERRPDHVLLLTWNFADEILRQQADFRAAGGRFVVPVPNPRVV